MPVAVNDLWDPATLWYDNEWGYTNRLVDPTELVAEQEAAS